MLTLPPALAALARWPQFVCWFAVPSQREPGKMDKLPCRWDTGEVCDAHDVNAWATAEVALAMAARWDKGHGSGVGFVLTESDPFFFLDIDGALQPDGTWSALSTDLCRVFAGAAVEVSQSGRGLHILGCATPVPHRKKNTTHHLELYTSRRFVALTGTHATGNVWTDHTAMFASVVAGLFQPVLTDGVDGWTTEPVAEWAGPEDDDALIARAMRAQARQSAAAAFSGAASPPTFAQLWEADVAALSAYWPGTSGPYDASSADQALANNLAFFTGKNCERMERIMRRSKLVREKWDVRPDYLSDTIVKACAFVRTVLNEPDRPPPPRPVALEQRGSRPVMAVRTAPSEYMDPQEQARWFDGCCYVASLNQIYVPDRGQLMGKSAFDVVYGGFLFVLDPLGKKTTDSAFDALTKSRVLQVPVADEVCFRPELEPGAVVEDAGRTLVNTYRPYSPERIQGDPEPFLDLLRRLLPDENDRNVLLHYMASLVQNPGVKFQWWPVLQGPEGNGKTLLMTALAYAVGEHYTHMPNAAAMAREGLKFNHWIHRKLFIGVEEIYTSDRRSFLEEFKTVVTNERIGMEPKGAEQVTRDNRANGMLATNHRDGVPINTDTRRYAIFYTAQQSVEDIIRDGMGGEYFPQLWSWFKGQGRAIVAEYLATFPLQAELDPAQLSVRAPRTSSWGSAIRESRGKVEQEILEAIESGRPGFCGGFVSSRYVDDLIDRLRVHVPRHKRDDMLKSLGFTPHPGLPLNGRTNRVVKPDGCRTRLFIPDGHLSLQLTDPEGIAAAYERSQSAGAAEAAFGNGLTTVKA